MLKRLFRHKRDNSSDSGALTDLAFLLIIYFIVIAGFSAHQGFLMNLPDKNKPRVVNREDLLRYKMNRNGEIFHDGTILTGEMMKEEIGEFLTDNPNMTLVLTIDPDAPYQNMVDVVHTVRALHVENFSFKMDSFEEVSQ